ncbi:hypothetical protein [Clostridium sp. 'White wine YQ']|uniref:hypothetical protein n=1 Tax=Clostridium sp. 'White wine YQ' TaxID=3027474 RepID=UPI0023663BB1|nr:hypothetical protein [Clostridium sp. 'White wine YQ']MDD7794498.1 hypothetical protein [Clostridium sp. 'White wine YQ']
MVKKKFTMLASLVLGGSLLLGTVVVNASQLSGYETYKKAVLSTKELKNETATVKVSVTDNDASLLNVTETFKQNEGSNAMSSVTTIASSGKTQTISNYLQNGQRVEKTSDSDVYSVSGSGDKKYQKEDKAENPQVVQAVGVIVDTLVGNMKDGVSTTDNGDGTKAVTIKLNDSQITPLVNAVASIAMAKNNEKGDIKDLKNVLPQLQSEVKVVSVDSSANINKNDIITSQSGKLIISGKDATGKLHTIAINVDLQLSNIDGTTPDTVDLTGKQTKTMDSFKGHRD